MYTIIKLLFEFYEKCRVYNTFKKEIQRIIITRWRI